MKHQEQSDTQEATADGTPDKEAPASETRNPPTTPPDANTAPAVVTAEEDYETLYEKALSEAPASQEEQSEEHEAIGEGAEEESTEEEPSEQSMEDASEENPPKSSEFRPRLSKLNERAKEAILLVKERVENGERISLAEAERRVAAKYGEDNPKEGEKPPGGNDAPRTPEQIDEEIKAAKEERRTAVRDIDAEAQLEAEDRIEALQEEKRAAENRLSSQEQSEEKRFHAEVAKSHQQAQELYPQMEDADHEIHAKAGEIWQAMRDSNNPLIYDATSPLKVYQMAANELGIPPGGSKTSSSFPATTAATNGAARKPRPQAVQQQAVVTNKRAVSPASGGARTQPHPGQTNADPASRIKTAADYEAFLEEAGV